MKITKVTQFLLAAVILCATFSTGKAQALKIVNPGDLYSSYKLADYPSELETVKAMVSPYELSKILKYSNESAWPSGISTLTARTNMREKFKEYKVYKTAEFDNKYILIVPAAENKHMPYDMQSTNDIYFVMAKTGVSDPGTSNSYINDNIENSGGLYTATPAKIIATGGLYSTYNVESQSAEIIRSLKSQVGSEYNSIVTYSKESNWPSGIANISARDLVREKMNDYRAYVIADVNGMYLLRIKREDNTFMPYNMQPSSVIYFFIKKEDVQVGKTTTGNTGNYNTDKPAPTPPAPTNNYNNGVKPIGGN